MTISLNAHLQDLNADLLKGWLRRVGALDKTYTRKEHFARAIEQQLTLKLPEILARLSEAERNLLAESAHQRRLISVREFTARYGGTCPIPKAYYGWREEVSLLIAFIHRGGDHDAEPPDLIPSLIEPLRALLPKPCGLKAQTVETVPAAWPSERHHEGGDLIRPIHVFESERIAPAELARVLRLIQGGKVKVTDATRRPTDATTRLVGQALVVSDFDLEMIEAHKRDPWDREYYEAAGPVRAHAWPVLVQQCGWARSKGGLLTLTESGKNILQQFTPERHRAGVALLLANGDFDELNRVNHIRGQTGKAKQQMSDPGMRKTAIARALEAFPVGQWLKFEEARRLIEAAPESWDVLKSNFPALYFCELQYGCIYESAGINRQFLRAFLMESLAALGVLDIAYVYPHQLWPDLGGVWGTDDLHFCGRYDGLLYVRLNPLGACALGFTDHYDLRVEEKPKLFRVLPNHDLELASGPLNPADRAMLELLASPRGDKVWTLDIERILTHVETGGTFQELCDFLESNADEELPEDVHDFLADLEAKLGACRARREAVLLEWADESLAQFVATSAVASRLCFHAGQNRLVVPGEHLAAFSRAVKKLGFVLPSARTR